jgi:CheY-like chemotaxis protein
MPPHTNLPAEQSERIWQLTLPIHGAHVLLVEDNATNQFIATQFLNKMALRIDVAHHGREAVEMVAEHDYDAVLMDLQMPTMDGLEATRLIRTTEKGRELPIIAMTAAAMLADREATEAAGMNAHIAKPIDLDELAATLTTWITPKNSAVAGGKQSLSRGIDQDQAFALPGLNLAAAVARLDNNWSSLHKVLKAFQQDFGNAIERLHDDLKNDRYEDAKRLAHTIKGLAHSIGAETLEASAQRFERDLMSGTTHGLPDFARELDAALTAIAELQDTPHAVNEILAGQEALDSGEFRALLCELAAMVGDSIILSTDFKEQVRRGLRGHVGGADIEQLLTHVNQLDYTSAQQELKLIADRTGIDLAS